MQAGKLNKRITIQRNEPTADGLGEMIAGWVNKYENVPAAIEPLQGRELFAARQFNAELTHKITIRYELRDIKAADRVTFRDANPVITTDRAFNVESVRNIDEKGEWFEMLCVELVGRS